MTQLLTLLDAAAGHAKVQSSSANQSKPTPGVSDAVFDRFCALDFI
ncbi:hypothetical protein IV102_18295 [bacterium]|nr:hypothetical protein [bacterium]